MIELHRPPGPSELADRVEEALRDLVVSHRVVEAAVAGADLPRVRDGDRTVPREELTGYLDELREQVGAWRRFQSDACYVDDDGEVC